MAPSPIDDRDDIRTKHTHIYITFETDLRRVHPCQLRRLFPRFVYLWAHRRHVHRLVRRDVYVNADPSILSPRSFTYVLLSSSSHIGHTLADEIICSPGREYAAADTRWGTADPTVVSLELLTVFGAGPLAAYIVYQIVKGDPTRYYWIIVLCTAEIYGGYVFPEAPLPPRAIRQALL